MRCGAGLDPNQARLQLLNERYEVAALQVKAHEHVALRIGAVHLKDRLLNLETDDWLLRIVGALTAPTSLALMYRWSSRPQHQNRTYKTEASDIWICRTYFACFPYRKYYFMWVDESRLAVAW
jgi:hypothetical protein